MRIKLQFISSTSALFELENDDIVKTQTPYTIFLNDQIYKKDNDDNVFSLYHLKPNTSYQLTIVDQVSQLSTSLNFQTEVESVCLNVKRFNAKGNGLDDDTLAIQAAIMACPSQGRVYIPKGIYRVKTIFLKSDLTLEFEEGATLLSNLTKETGAILPGYTVTSNQEEYYLGSWEGNPLDTFSALIQGINVNNIKIIGEGILDGNSQSDWWKYPKIKRGAWRPRLFQLINCQSVTLQGLTLTNSPSWTIHPLWSSDLIFADLKIINPKDSPNTDGLDPESCKNILILGVYFSVGDDCIAIKSGKIYLGKRLKRPSENIQIRNCSMNFGHGAVVIGSEMAGGVKNILVERCLFNETDRGLRIKTRRGRGKDAIIEQITFRNIKMKKVISPLVINSFYFCDPDGHSDYVKSKEALSIDERIPLIRDCTFERLQCVECEAVASYFYGLPEQPIEKIKLKDCSFSFLNQAKPNYPAMMDDIRPYCKEGLIVTNVKELEVKNVSFEGVLGDELILNQVQKVVSDCDTKKINC